MRGDAQEFPIEGLLGDEAQPQQQREGKAAIEGTPKATAVALALGVTGQWRGHPVKVGCRGGQDKGGSGLACAGRSRLNAIVLPMISATIPNASGIGTL